MLNRNRPDFINLASGVMPLRPDLVVVKTAYRRNPETGTVVRLQEVQNPANPTRVNRSGDIVVLCDKPEKSIPVAGVSSDRAKFVSKLNDFAWMIGAREPITAPKEIKAIEKAISQALTDTAEAVKAKQAERAAL